jgi:hypothetical protein
MKSVGRRTARREKIVGREADPISPEVTGKERG